MEENAPEQIPGTQEADRTGAVRHQAGDAEPGARPDEADRTSGLRCATTDLRRFIGAQRRQGKRQGREVIEDQQSLEPAA